MFCQLHLILEWLLEFPFLVQYVPGCPGRSSTQKVTDFFLSFLMGKMLMFSLYVKWLSGWTPEVQGTVTIQSAPAIIQTTVSSEFCSELATSAWLTMSFRKISISCLFIFQVLSSWGSEPRISCSQQLAFSDLRNLLDK